MIPAIIMGFGNLGRAIAATIEATGGFDIVAVIETDPLCAGRRLPDFLPGSRFDARIHRSLSECPAVGPALLFHATTSSVAPATGQIMSALEAGHSVVSAAEWLFHPWLRFGKQAAAFDAAAKARSARVLGCGINPGFCFETLPILLSRTIHSLSSVDILRVSNVSGVGPADFAHLGFGISGEEFSNQVEAGSIEGHMGFPESIAALAECLRLPIDRITDHLVPTLAEQPLQLAKRLVAPGEVVGITQNATGMIGDKAVIRMKLEMFLDPEGYGRSPQEAVTIEASRSFNVSIKPAAPPVAGAAAMMVSAATDLPMAPPGLTSLLDLPMGGSWGGQRLRQRRSTRSREGTSIELARSEIDVVEAAR